MEVNSKSDGFRKPRNYIRSCLAQFGILLLAITCNGASATTVSLSQIFPANKVVQRDHGQFSVEFLDQDAPWANDVISRSDAARRDVARTLNDAFLVRIHLLLAPDRETFLKLVGHWAENAVAVAVSDSMQVVINLEALRRGPPENYNETLVHELTHLYLGFRCKEPLPRWLNEGIAMNVSGEAAQQETSMLVLGDMLGRGIPIGELAHAFPAEPNRQQIAYRESAAFVDFLAHSEPHTGIADLARSIAGDEGRAKLHLFSDETTVANLETRWRKSLRGLPAWAHGIFGSGLLWGGILLLAILAWIVRRWRSRELRREWEEEEQIYGALDEEEDQVWGEESDEFEEEQWRGRE